jgi:hypothetical protein
MMISPGSLLEHRATCTTALSTARGTRDGKLQFLLQNWRYKVQNWRYVADYWIVVSHVFPALTEKTKYRMAYAR